MNRGTTRKQLEPFESNINTQLSEEATDSEYNTQDQGNTNYQLSNQDEGSSPYTIQPQ
jgi:hypothetical protein